MGCYWWDKDRNVCVFPWKDYYVCLGKSCLDYEEDVDEG